MRHRSRYAPARTFESRNKILAKRTAIQLIALLGNLFLLLLKILAGVFILARGGAIFLIRLLVRLLVLPLYRGLKYLVGRLAAMRRYWQKQFGENFSRNVALYGGLALASIFTTATNLAARELRPEDIGRQSSLYLLLAQNTDFELVEEEALYGEEALRAVTRESGENNLAALGVQNQGEPTGDEIASQLPLFSESGDALLKPDLTGTEIAPERRSGIITYTVEEGDTISEIADKFDISTNTILWENSLGARDFIRPGQKLAILPVTGVSHTVKRGETLSGIATRYRAKDEDIIEINKLASAKDLKIGEKIIVPDGIPPSPARSPITPRRETRSNLADLFKSAPQALGRFNWPTVSRRISQYFRGWRHTGLDIPAPTGQPVYAAEDGVVITSGWSRGGYGIYIVVDHGDGVQTLYGHNSRNLVERGDRVSKGQVIGSIGSTGRSTGPHVHFEVRINGNRVNPLDYL